MTKSKKKKKKPEKLAMTYYQQIMTPLSFLLFMLHLEQSGIWIREGWSMTFTFSLITTFHITKFGNGTRNYVIWLSYYCFE